MKTLPQTRNENIVVQESGIETLVYDLTTNKAYCLNETCTKVFHACGNHQTFEDLKKNHKFPDDLIYFALDELQTNNLIEGEVENYFAGMNRREVIKKVGLTSIVALPVISALVAPQASNAASNSCSAGACVPPLQDYCVGCIGRTVNFTQYSSTDGTCTGRIIGSGSFACQTQGFTGVDLTINSVT